ncbi:MAG: two-component system, OmpR family, response regulator [Actinomycetota bacterium]|nr:two-component system, OmpR family, response regulator [Actinomycetota bacterium]MEA2932411.1 two-component system, OmpR family, response regulator [Actinomycetota bacterium]
MASLLDRALVREGYAVDLAASGEEALWAVAESNYDAIVLDAMIPPPDGYEVCRRLRAQDRWNPILMLTARDRVDDRVRGLDAGADDYLTKPFALGELMARLRALTRRDLGTRPVELRVGDLALDTAQHEVRLADEPVVLSPKEFALLALFMRHPGDVMSRTRILDHVWDFAYDGGSNVVDVYVGYLRRKLGGDRIETVRGVGYRLRADG